MPDFSKTFEKAKTSSFSLWLLNFGLSRIVPFNRPHGFKVSNLTDDSVETYAPYKTKNLNHIKGIHACALATISEFTTGVFLISKFGTAKYRIILRHLEMEYHYQGKTEIRAQFGLNSEEVNRLILDPLKSSDSVDVTCEVKTIDAGNNHISTGKVTWQIKEWEKVRTRI